MNLENKWGLDLRLHRRMAKLPNIRKGVGCSFSQFNRERKEEKEACRCCKTGEGICGNNLLVRWPKDCLRREMFNVQFEIVYFASL